MSAIVVGYMLSQNVAPFFDKPILLPKTPLQHFDHISLLKIPHIMGIYPITHIIEFDRPILSPTRLVY